VDGIYAIGDIIATPALAHVASMEAIVCIEKIAGKDVRPVNYNIVPSCIYTHPEIASVGLSEQKAIEKGLNIKIGKFQFMASGKAAATGNKDGFVKVVVDAESNVLLGCTMVGDNVTEMIAEVVVLLEKQVTTKEAIHYIHPHPTMSEGFLEAVRSVEIEN
ncbi:MAG: dihydrolipoyl dehydrogenase, partial [Bacteroidales bacterium]|jgi:dihydrolipoamide dehydrogenase|nr:dihydrolipoyl dehydrogenase [Bacteroidales bacterium]